MFLRVWLQSDPNLNPSCSVMSLVFQLVMGSYSCSRIPFEKIIIRYSITLYFIIINTLIFSSIPSSINDSNCAFDICGSRSGHRMFLTLASSKQVSYISSRLTYLLHLTKYDGVTT